MNTNALRLLLGRVVDGRYLLEEWLGGGSFGGVFLAGEYVDDRRLRTVAVKLLPAESGPAGEAQRRELEVSLNLDHPNLLRCFSAGRCEVEGFDVLYLTMEVAETSLEARLLESRLTEEETRSLAHDLAAALSHLHARNLVHRDVKPGNVLRVGDAWKLADFGLVRQADRSEIIASDSRGTALYMSPEALDGKTGAHVDIWALGVMLQQGATGALPYNGESANQMITAILTKQPAIATGMPGWLESLVRACLSKDRSNRPSAQDLVGRFDQSLPRNKASVSDKAMGPWAKNPVHQDGVHRHPRGTAFQVSGPPLQSAKDRNSALRLLRGRVLNKRYLLEEWLGCSTVGGVFLAGEYVDDRRVRTVAARLIPAESGPVEEAKQELEVSLNLDHPNLLRCYSVGQCEVEGFHGLYLTMEVAEASLEARLLESRLTEEETRSLAHDLAVALSYLHSRNLVHRKVKPGSVLRVGNSWKLADFGLPRVVEHLEVTISWSKGTALYMSPEAVEGQTGPHVDIWALGVLLQQAASGTLAYTGGSQAELIASLLTKEPTIADGLPGWLDGLVRDCLAKDRAKRPSAEESMRRLSGVDARERANS